jgi:hypothetical protein
MRGKFILTLFAALAVAGSACADTLTGLWRGEYTCGQGLTALTLAMNQNARGDVRAVMTFSAHPKNPGVPTGCFTMAGRYNARSGALTLKQGKWLKQPDPDWYMIDFSGAVARDGAHYAGKVVFPDDGLCTTFAVTRVSRAPPPLETCDGPVLVS